MGAAANKTDSHNPLHKGLDQSPSLPQSVHLEWLEMEHQGGSGGERSRKEGALEENADEGDDGGEEERDLEISCTKRNAASHSLLPLSSSILSFLPLPSSVPPGVCGFFVVVACVFCT